MEPREEQNNSGTYWIGIIGACAVTALGVLIGYGKCQEKYEKIMGDPNISNISFRDVNNDGLEDVVIKFGEDKKIYYGRKLK